MRPKSGEARLAPQLGHREGPHCGGPHSGRSSPILHSNQNKSWISGACEERCSCAEGIYNDIGIVQTLQPFLRHFDSVLFEAFGKASKIKINLTAIALTAIVIVLMAIKVSIDQLRADVRAAARDVARARKEQ